MVVELLLPKSQRGAGHLAALDTCGGTTVSVRNTWEEEEEVRDVFAHPWSLGSCGSWSSPFAGPLLQLQDPWE